MIAPVLYLNIGSGVLRGMGELHFLVIKSGVNINDTRVIHCLIIKLPTGSVRQIGFQYIYKVFFAVIAHSQINAGITEHLFLTGLYVAAHSHYHSLRITLLGLMQHLPALAVRNIGHSAGIDNIYVCPLVKRHNLIALFFQFLTYYIHFV